MFKLLYACLFISLAWINPDVEAAALIYHAPSAVVYHHRADIVAHEQHPGYTIVAPLTKIAHVTYDSVPISHSPYEHVPLFQRIGHVKGLRVY